MKLPQSYYNWTSVIGTVIAAINLFLIFFFIIISVVFDQGGSYTGLFAYLVLPLFLIFGLLLIPIGMVTKMKRDKRKKTETKRRWPLVDLNNRAHRNAFLVFVTTTTLFLLLSAVGSYEIFHYTESTEFCGLLCHSVMEPEYTTYHNSAHARVACVDCHVGSGADWYVRSKLSGLYQVYSVIFKKYPQPIETPLANLRPARETCEQCHWPEKFTPHFNRFEKYFLADEQNSEWDISLQMKIGSPYSARGLEEGIHWHIHKDVKVEYIAADETREYISWVRFTNTKTGEVTVYEDQDYPLEGDISEHEIRTMDCMDCHNRPSHSYLSPSNFVDRGLGSGIIPSQLPEIKKVAMDILLVNFEYLDSALMYVNDEVSLFYSENYPEISEQNPELIESAILGIQNGLKNNIFPFMKVRWVVYPNHIGHLESKGCSRCHDNLHVTATGRTIPRDCNLCHTITAQGNPGNLETGSIYDSLEFKHPVNIDEAWREYLCVECHLYLY